MSTKLLRREHRLDWGGLSLRAFAANMTDDLRTRLGTAASSARPHGGGGGATHPLWRALDRAARASLWATTLVWVWSTADGRARAMGARPSWRTVQLPTLPTAMRRWSPSSVPGTYPIDAALVDEIRGRYL